MTMSERLGRIGIWSPLWSVAARSGDLDQIRAASAAAAELEDLGYGAIWLGASPSVEFAGRLLDATGTVTVATGITNIWQHDASTVAAAHADLERRHPGRFLLGLGVSHSEANPAYARPYEAMRRYLDEIDAAVDPAPPGHRVLAALGPRMLTLARDRAAGAHPYLVTVDQVAEARAILGPDALLAPELTVVLDDDLARARNTARGMLVRYLKLRNYVASFIRAGFNSDDFGDGGSHRLLDAVFGLGGPDAVGAKVRALHQAGADHVAIQALSGSPAEQRDVWRRLRAALAAL
jgi:probable F420-dependent oxidoreductase